MSFKIKQICLKSSLFLSFLLLLQSVSAQYDFSAIDALLDKNKKALGNDVVAMVWKDTLLYKKEMGEYFNARMQAPIANASRWLTAALVMTFVEDGTISLDDPVVKYIPIFHNYAKNYITIRNCLTNTTGIEADPPTLRAILKPKKFDMLEEQVNSFAASEIEKNPGEMFYYSDIGSNIAGRVLEVVGKKSFDRLMKDRIFRPLKMKRSTFTDFNGLAVNPSGGGQCSAEDYMNFLIMLLQNGKFEDKQVLKPESIALMETMNLGNAEVKYVPEMAKGYDYGMGVWIAEKDNSGKAMKLTCPGLYGTWVMIDRCRGYAVLLLVKDLKDEQKKEFYQRIEDIIDDEVRGNCP